jgi:hypothetical protein
VYRWYDPADRSQDSEASAEEKSRPNNTKDNTKDKTKAPPHFPQNFPESNTNLLPKYLPSNTRSQCEAPAAPPEDKDKVLNSFYFLKRRKKKIKHNLCRATQYRNFVFQKKNSAMGN